jgi:hypothetical protein
MANTWPACYGHIHLSLQPQLGGWAVSWVSNSSSPTTAAMLRQQSAATQPWLVTHHVCTHMDKEAPPTDNNYTETPTNNQSN